MGVRPTRIYIDIESALLFPHDFHRPSLAAFSSGLLQGHGKEKKGVGKDGVWGGGHDATFEVGILVWSPKLA